MSSRHERKMHVSHDYKYKYNKTSSHVLKATSFEIKQLDVGVSPPAFSFTFIVTLTFDPDL